MSFEKTTQTNSPEKEKVARQSSWINDLLHVDPVHIISDMWDALDMWRATRSWRPMLLMIPGAMFLLSILGATTYAAIFTKSKVLMNYAKKAAEVDPGQKSSSKRLADEKKDEGTELAAGVTSEDGESADETVDEAKKAEAEQEIKDSLFAELLYKRILQLRSDNKQARYYVARMHGQRGNIAMARRMMTALAPSDALGHIPAHAWLAADCLSRVQAGEKFDRVEFLHHINSALDFRSETWWAQVLGIYAKMLEAEDKNLEAVNMLQRASSIEPRYLLALSDFFTKHEQKLQGEETALQAVAKFSENLGKRDEEDIDRILVAEAYMLAGKSEEALKVINDGLRLRPERPDLRRALSEIYRRMFRAEISQEGSGLKVNPQLLNMAIYADPTNPGVGDEIMWLQSMGVTVEEKLIDSLRQQLAANGASAVAHLLLGNAYYNKNELNKAIDHWQLAQGEDPNMVLALNNLAVAFSKLDPPDIEKALKLIDRAIELTKGNAEFYDSKGEILMAGKRYVESIAAFEKSLSYPTTSIMSVERNIATREKLIKAYKAAGLDDMIDAQITTIAKIRENLRARGVSDSGMSILIPQKKKDAGAESEAERLKKVDVEKDLEEINRGRSDQETVAPSDDAKKATPTTEAKPATATPEKSGKKSP